MTGYGKATTVFQDKKITAEIKSLNSKALDLSARIAPIYREKEMEVRSMIATALERGKVEFNLWIEKDSTSGDSAFNVDMVKNYYQQIKSMCEVTGIPEPEPHEWISLIQRLPDVMVKNDAEELTDEEWALIQKLELNVFVKDGDGYIDMGLDNTFDWYDDTSVLLDFDGTWLTINGKACAYYLVSDTKLDDDSWTTIGRIPALLNGEFVNLQVVFDKAHPDGTITGAYPLYEDDENVDVQAKGNIEIKAGDKIELLCDYYDLDGNYSESYKLGTSFTVPASGLKITNLKLNAEDISATFRATDIYGNYYWIPIN